MFICFLQGQNVILEKNMDAVYFDEIQTKAQNQFKVKFCRMTLRKYSSDWRALPFQHQHPAAQCG